jgi:hypothetical protein
LIAGFAVILLGIHWALLKLVPVPGFGAGRLDSLGNIGAYVDRTLLGTRHLWAWGLTPGYGVTFDPEGLLSTLPAIASLLIGVIGGEWLRTEYSTKRAAFALAAAGLISRARRLAATSAASDQQETVDQHLRAIQRWCELVDFLGPVFDSRCQALEVVDASSPCPGHERDPRLRTF